MGQHAALHSVRGPAMCARALAARRAGARILREDFFWSVIERRRGHFDWRFYDRLVAVAAQHGLTVLPELGYPPGWAARSSLAIPSRPEAFARYAARVVARYGPGGSFWRGSTARRLARVPPRWFEFFNEPYLPTFSAGRPDPGNYARLVRAAFRAGRAANRRARFLIGADTTWTASNGNRHDWLADMYAAVPDLNRYFDGVSVHPYTGVSPYSYSPEGDTRGQARRLEQIRASLLRRRAGSKHLWVTEIGWTTCSRPDDGCVSESDQAAFYSQFLQLAQSSWRGFVDAVFGYELRDYLPPGYPQREGSFGLLRGDDSPKPAWQVFRAYAG